MTSFPLEIVNKPGLVYYGDTFTLSAVGGSGSDKVTWSSAPAGIVEIDANGFVKVIGVGSATITATKPGGVNYRHMWPYTRSPESRCFGYL